MAVQAIGQTIPNERWDMVQQARQTDQAPKAGQALKADGAPTSEEITTVTTHCDKEHKHDRSCPHTVSTRPAPQQGEPGYNFDARA